MARLQSDIDFTFRLVPLIVRTLEAQGVAPATRQANQLLAATVRDEICRRLGKAEVTIEAVAAALVLSPRTLQRRLRVEGLSFQDVLDQAREQSAKTYLVNAALSVSEIAYRLGYSELRAFDRAFRRWTGQTPVSWRRGAPLSRATTATM